MDRNSRRLDASDLYRLKWLLGALMGLVCVTTLFNIDGYNIAPATFVVSVLLFYLAFPSVYVKTPVWIWKIYAFGILPLVVFDVMAKETAPALLNLNTWLILYRALNHDRRREEMQLVLLCLFLLVMAGILTASIVFGIQLLLFAVFGIAFLVTGTALECKSEGKFQRFRSRQLLADGLGLSKVLGAFQGRNLLQGTILFGSVLSVASLAFLFIPRVDLDKKVSLFKMNSSGSLSGFSESIQLGEVTNIKKDNRVALRVDVSGADRVPLSPHWRMLALDSYDKGNFSMSKELKDLLKSNMASHYHANRYWRRMFSTTPSQNQVDRWTFYLEPGISRFLPMSGDFAQMNYTEIDELKLSPYAHVISLGEAPSKMVSYQMESVDFTGKVPDVSVFDYPIFAPNRRPDLDLDRKRVRYPNTLLELPDDPRIREYLDGVVQEISHGVKLTPLEFATLATQYLEGQHSYSMSSSLPPAPKDEIQDPVIRWMKSDLPGHCEYFASSLILLCRSAGFPARAVVGFKGGDWNSYEKYFMVRNADAHAWCEIYDGRGSWFRADPTPGSVLPAVPTPTAELENRAGVSGSWAYIDSLRMLWYRRIVNYDESAQREAAVRLKEFFLAYIQVAEEWAVHAAKWVYAWATEPWTLRKTLSTSLLLALLVAFFWVQRNLALNYRELLLAPFRRGDPIRRKASKLLKRMSSMEERRPDKATGEGRDRILMDLKRLRFGAKDSWPNPRIVFKSARRWT